MFMGRKFWHAASAWTPVFFMLVAIAIESTPSFGSDRTSGPLRLLFQRLFGSVSDERWNLTHFYIRKTGHFLGYGAMGIAWFRAFHGV